MHFKGKVHTLDIASSCITTSEALGYGTCSQWISQFYLHTHTFIRNRNAFAFPAIAGTHLLTRMDGRLSWPGWLVT